MAIYLHIPFCESKCIYCDFASFCNAENEKVRYLKSLNAEIDNSPYKGREIDTIYIGGGTPSCVKEEYIEELLSTLRKNFVFSNNIEISMECNPNSVNLEKLKKYRSLGLNRISFGVQSLHDALLKKIGRLHNGEIALQAIKMAQRAGFENINADLLIGLPNSTIEGIIDDAGKLIQAGITHISAYMLQVEEGAKLYALVKSGKIFLPTDDESVAQYEALVSFLEKKGFIRYEISNFAKGQHECRHNLKYWSGAEYLGFGLGAHSYVEGVRKANARTFEGYYKGEIFMEKLTPKESIEEMIMLGLRCRLGFSKAKLFKHGYKIENNINFKTYLSKGILTENGDRVHLNPSYYGTSNYIIANLLP